MFIYQLMRNALTFLGKLYVLRPVNRFSSGLLPKFLFVILFSAKSAMATPVTAVELFDPLENYQNDFSWTLGYSFYLDYDANLIELGFYDALGDGFNEDHEVGIWDQFGTLLASVVVSNNSRLDALFRWEPITPIELIAGVQYTIAGFTSIDDYTWNPQDYYVNDAVWFTCAGYTFSESLEYPAECYWELIGFFGPNFIFDTDLDIDPPVEVSEPKLVTVAAIGCALVLLVLAPRRGAKKRVSTLLLYPLSLLALSNSANALEIEAYPTQGGNTHDDQVLLLGKYFRYTYENVGGLFKYPNPFDTQGNYLVPVGETLRFALYRDDFPYSSFEVRYLGGDEHCWVVNNSSQRCGSYINLWLVYLPAKCFDEKKTYKIRLTRNGGLLQEQTFKAERFKMKLTPESWTIPTQLKPMAYNEDQVGEKKPLAIRVTDDLGCGVGLQDVEVTAQTFVGDFLNKHAHFKQGDPGVGRFVQNGTSITLSEGNTKAVGKTDSMGNFKLDYQAMHFALREDVKFTFKRPAENGDLGETQHIDRTWDIKYGDFSPDPYGYLFAFTGACQLAHPGTGARHLRSDVWPALKSGLDKFYERSSKKVSLNDGSFPWGGAVDTVESTCDNHLSHRTGIDMDMNRTSIGGTTYDITKESKVILSIQVPDIGLFELKQSYLDMLTNSMDEYGFDKVDEEPLHFRKRK